MSNYNHERGWLDSEVWGNAPYSEREAWSWMIGEANWKDSQKNINGYPVMILRGQFTSSLRFMADKFKWQKNKVDRYLKKLVAWNMVKIGTANGTGQNIITICNYNEYQIKNGKSGTANGTQNELEWDRSGTGAGQTRNPSNPSNQLNKTDFELAVSAWNEIAQEYNLSKVIKINKDRGKKLSNRLKDCGGIEGWNSALLKIPQSDFCLGKKTDWKINFDFLLKESSFIKLLEGAYDNNKNNQSNQNGEKNGKLSQNSVARVQRAKPVTPEQFAALCNPDLS